MKRILIIMLILLSLTGCNNQNQEQQVKPTVPLTKAAANVENSNVVVKFKNPQLEAKVSETLGKTSSDITNKDALKINKLDLDLHIKEQVSQDLPSYDFDVQGYRTKDGYNYVANNITISNNGKLIQKIELVQDEVTGYPTSYDENFGFTIEDMNFDGYKDLRIIRNASAAPNISYCMWIWNSKTNQFEENNDLEHIISPEFDHDKKLITSYILSSASDHYEDTYQYIDGILTLKKSIAVGYVNDEDPQNIYYIEHQLIKGKWELIKKEKYELDGH